LLICTTWALVLRLFNSDPQLERFFYLAEEYNCRIVEDRSLTAQQNDNMHHILIIFVVYDIIFFGVKTVLKVRNNKQRTAKEIAYVPIPKGGIKMSMSH
jgi:pyruvate/proton symporter